MNSGIQEAVAQAMTFVWGIWRHKWLALGVAWVVSIAGWLYVATIPEAYEAKARLYVDTNTVLRPLLKGLAITPDIDQRVQMMSSTLFSRPNLEKLARMTDLDLQVSSDAEREKLINMLRRTISLQGQRRNSSLYDVAVTHPDRDMAGRITQAIITIFIENSLAGKRDDSTGAQDFLDGQIADYENRLVDAEERLARFKQENVGVLPSQSRGDYYARLESLRENLVASRLALKEAEQRRDALQDRLRGGGDTSDLVAATGLTTPTDLRIQQMRLRLDELLTRYTDRHPEVRQIKGLMQDLERQREVELAQISQGGAVSGSNAVIGDMRTLLSESEAVVAELTVRVAEYERREVELASKVTLIPEIEAQLKQLDRDYEVVKSQHTTLLQRREAARLSQGVEDNASDVTFRVIDPPFVPQEPSYPNKPLLNLLVLVVGAGAGAGVGLLLSMLHPIVVDARMLAATTGLPLLGVVTANKDARQQTSERMRLAAFGAACLLLMCVFIGTSFVPRLLEAMARL